MTESTPIAAADGSGGRRTALRAGIIAGGVLAALGLLYGVAAAVSSGEIPRGTEVLGVPIGGRSVEDGQARLAEALPGKLPAEMTVVAADKRLTKPVGDLGLGVDFAATAEKAKSGWASPLRLLGGLFGGGKDIEPVPTVDQEKLDDAVEAMNGEVRLGFVEGGLTFDTGVPVAVTPVAGRGLDDDQLGAELVRAFLAGDDEIEAQIVDVQPEIDQAAVDRAIAGIGGKAMSAPVTITVAKDSIELQPIDFGRFLSTEPDNGELKLVVDGPGLLDSLKGKTDELGKEPRDAKFRFSGDDDEEDGSGGDGEVEILPSRSGVSLNADLLGTRLAEVLGTDVPRTLDAGARTEQAEFTTEDAEALDIHEKISSFKTFYPYAAYRVTNIGRAAELINGTILMPDDIFSLNKIVGERTAANGFVKGFIIKNGQFAEDLGGGVSQSATTTYNAAFFAGLKDIEHNPHSLYISRYPAGREATVSFGEKDLRFQNDSGYAIYVQATHKVGSIAVSMWGTKVWGDIESISGPKRNITSPKSIESEVPDCDDQAPADGFDITVTRVFRKGGEEVKRESYDTHYDATDKITCVEPGNGTKSPTPQPSGSAAPTKTPKPSKSPTSGPSSTPAPPSPTPNPAVPPNPSGSVQGSGRD
ncbi:VanW family protein [Sporichthya sp.]|uniref:VanW family protein n=1 Tax=Sporichthya sp. TaxID=65475 RepID=UPI0017E65107|nr:VanW family protein [Sporichthya sp.]MBA3742161.1 VanW family protein [Sporichthya sp.]